MTPPLASSQYSAFKSHRRVSPHEKGRAATGPASGHTHPLAPQVHAPDASLPLKPMKHRHAEPRIVPAGQVHAPSVQTAGASESPQSPSGAW